MTKNRFDQKPWNWNSWWGHGQTASELGWLTFYTWFMCVLVCHTTIQLWSEKSTQTFRLEVCCIVGIGNEAMWLLTWNWSSVRVLFPDWVYTFHHAQIARPWESRHISHEAESQLPSSASLQIVSHCIDTHLPASSCPSWMLIPLLLSLVELVCLYMYLLMVILLNWAFVMDCVQSHFCFLSESSPYVGQLEKTVYLNV